MAQDKFLKDAQGYLNEYMMLHNSSGTIIKPGYNVSRMETTLAKGTYKVTVPALKVGYKITAYCTDQSKNKSKSSAATVKNSRLTTPKVTTYNNTSSVVKVTVK